METYSKLNINEKINCKGNIAVKSFVYGNGKPDIGRIILEDGHPTICSLLRTASEIQAHLYQGQGLFY